MMNTRILENNEYSIHIEGDTIHFKGEIVVTDPVEIEVFLNEAQEIIESTGVILNFKKLKFTNSRLLLVLAHFILETPKKITIVHDHKNSWQVTFIKAIETLLESKD